MGSFAQRLTMLRESRDLKKKELAQILNVSASCISQYESGESMPGHDILMRTAQFFGVSVDFLLANETEGFDLSHTFCEKVTGFDLVKACYQVPENKRTALFNIITALKD